MPFICWPQKKCQWLCHYNVLSALKPQIILYYWEPIKLYILQSSLHYHVRTFTTYRALRYNAVLILSVPLSYPSPLWIPNAWPSDTLACLVASPHVACDMIFIPSAQENRSDTEDRGSGFENSLVFFLRQSIRESPVSSSRRKLGLLNSLNGVLCHDLHGEDPFTIGFLRWRL
jgi:hypothetical protein